MSGNNSHNMFITPVVKSAIEQAIKSIGNKSKLAAFLGVGRLAVCRWVGTSSSTSGIAPDRWLKLRTYMEQNGIIKSGDVNFLTPDELHDTQIQPMPELTPTEERIIRAYRIASDEQKRMLLAIIATIDADEKEEVSIG